VDQSGNKDVTWLRADGKELTDADWRDPGLPCFGMLINGDASDEINERGHPVHDDTLLLVLSHSDADIAFQLPELAHRGMWAELTNTARAELTVLVEPCVRLLPYSLVLLRYGRDRRLAVEPSSRSADNAARSEQ
jgi:glycogen operon protein